MGKNTVSSLSQMEYHPLTPDRWADLESLFGKHGAYGGCWCMWWRLKRSEFEKNQGALNKLEMKNIVESGRIPGIIVYNAQKPVGWCSVAPRDEFGSLNRSRVLKKLDDKPVWSIVCFFILKKSQRNGIAQNLIRAAIDFVKSQGGQIIEAYPTVPRSDRVPPWSSFMGFPSMFEKAGFSLEAKPSASKIVMRYYISPNDR
ncbi:MAG: GNAT family N-acetyltransferase [Candidatus Neomarinimicrobiota bacterium]